MARSRTPMILVMKAVEETLPARDTEGQLEDVLLELAILADPDATVPLPLKVRWLRNRYTSNEEKPCIAFAFVEDKPQESRQGESYPSSGEAIRELALDIIIDVELPTEVEADEEHLIADIAGLEILSEIERRVIAVLKSGWIDQANDPTPLSMVSSWVQEIGVDNDEDLADFQGRLVSRVNVLYRVDANNPMVLLPGG